MRVFSLEGKTAIITGAAHGIGKAIALTFGDAGADAVVIADIDQESAEKTAEEVRQRGTHCMVLRSDIGSKTDVCSLVKRTRDEFGKIDILVNDAYTTVVASLLELDEDDWDRVIDTNLKGYFLCSQTVAKEMVVRRTGSIINIITGHLAKLSPHVGAYMVAKAGVAMLTKVLAVEVGEYNIRVNAIAPGIIKTRFSKPLWENDKGRRIWESQIPLGHLGEPDDIAKAALFLASDASSYVTGATIYVDGGLQA